ncbi:rhodanese-like domain-containing protein [Halotalea alkalilenta]|uniref:Sulfurtransferase n=1 Tax=Halotalea alkalilenta TaxID=376489 RepID=A0A172YBZ7_9GAMM|nr:rhodanese-like domain-containing protein [Halotalea alkalilenta]ANF56632.1 sulfurtransferase [Halotalea alkalilenta]
MIEQLFEFASRHPLLVGGFLAVLLVWILYEVRRSSANVVSSSEATRLINREDAIVIDLREPKEFKAGHISGARNIPDARLESRLSELDKFKDKPVILVCKTGQSSAAAAAKLDKAGFTRVTRLRGGISQWQADDLPTVTK